MKTGIIGLPQVGKTSLFQILTKAHLSAQAHANPREAHIGVAKVPDNRLDRLAALYNPKKLTHTSVEYVDVGAIGQDALKESTYIGHLRQVDALAHVVRAFEDPSIPHVGEIDPPLREMQMTPEDKKRIRGFMFLSEKPMLYVLNVSESTELGKELEAAISKFKLTEIASRPQAAATAVCGKVEAELVEISDADAAEFLSSYGLRESGLVRLVRTTYALLG